MKGLRWLLYLGVLLSTSLAVAKPTFIPNPYRPKQQANCKLHKLYCKIMELQPNSDPKWAMRFSNALVRYAKKYDMDPWLSLAIAMQESSLLFPKPVTKSIVFTRTCNKKGVCNRSHKIVEGHTDLGIFQFHVNTIISNDIDPVRLIEDLDYATDWHYQVLKKKIVQCKHLGEKAWACYHRRTPMLHANYFKKVSRYYHGTGALAKHNVTADVKTMNQHKKIIIQISSKK